MRTAARQGAPTGASTEPRESSSAPLGARAFELGRSWQRPPGAPSGPALTCDVEDYFQVSAFEPVIPKSSWNERECRLPRNIDRVLQLLSDAGATGTFFTLGWVAERFPSLVRQIADAGHEIASHGMLHRRVFEQTPDEFRADAGRAKRLLEDTSGTEVLGYRAPSWSIDLRTPWAHGILHELGYRYSSSIYPIAHDHYGVPNAPTAPFYPRSADILEIPASTVRLAGRNWPAAGGGYFRALPLPVSLWLLRYAERTQPSPMLFYFHPWEIDAEQPRVAGASRKARFRHYLNLDKMEPRLTVLLSAFSWGRMDRIFPTSA